MKTIYSIISYVERGTAGAKQVACTTAQGEGGPGEERGGERKGLAVKPTIVVDWHMTNL